MVNTTMSWVNEMYTHPCIPIGASPNALNCLGRVTLYATNVMIPHILSTASQATCASALWASQKLLEAPDWVLNNALSLATGKNPEISLYNTTATQIGEPLQKAIEHVDTLATKALTPNRSASSLFKASELICPTLLIGLSAYKALQNALNASCKLKQLVSGERIFTTCSIITADTSTEEKGCEISLITQKTETSFGLFVDTLVNGTWAAGWGAVSYYTYQEMVNTLTSAGNDQPTSQMITLALGMATAASPNFVTLKEWMQTKWTYPAPQSDASIATSASDRLEPIDQDNTVQEAETHTEEEQEPLASPISENEKKIPPKDVSDQTTEPLNLEESNITKTSPPPTPLPDTQSSAIQRFTRRRKSSGLRT